MAQGGRESLDGRVGTGVFHCPCKGGGTRLTHGALQSPPDSLAPCGRERAVDIPPELRGSRARDDHSVHSQPTETVVGGLLIGLDTRDNREAGIPFPQRHDTFGGVFAVGMIGVDDAGVDRLDGERSLQLLP